jgi:hypothetical protein
MPPADPPRDVTDRMMRQSLRDPDNLRDFLRSAVPDLADSFDYQQARLVDREYFLEDWRRREADLPFEIPYRAAAGEEWALVYVLIEHQSDTDPMMPLRLLYAVVCYWDRQWRDWEALPRPRPPLRLRPVLPLVLCTAATSWGSNKTLKDLLGQPAAFHAFAPAWAPLFWNLADRTPEQLLQSGAEWLQTMAILHVQGDAMEVVQAVCGEAWKKLADLQSRAPVRWSELFRMGLTFAVVRRPVEERDALIALALERCPPRRQEIENMTKTIAESWMEEGMQKGRLLGLRDALRTLLEGSFGTLPEEVVQRIEAASDPAKLMRAVGQAPHLRSLEELEL